MRKKYIEKIYDDAPTIYLIYNFIRLCVCVCVCVCVKAKCVDISARIATKLHTRTKNLPEKVLKPISIS